MTGDRALDGATLFYVYTVIEASAADALPDLPPPLGGGGLRLVSAGRHAAVVEAVDARHFEEEPLRGHLEDLEWLSAVARAHHGVVAAVGSATTTVPLRLATVCRGEEGVRRLLAGADARIAEALVRLAGAQEWGVKLYAGPPPEPPPGGGAEGGDPAAGAGGGRDYLRRRLKDRDVREASRTRAARTARDLHRELSRHAAAAVLHPPQDRRLSRADGLHVLNAAYLVPAAGREAFLEAVPPPDALDAGLRLEVTGPWVPYSFTAGADEEKGSAL
ncbi:GvpL/GvpF family gas vesicle protein [Streptomyces globosus]